MSAATVTSWLESLPSPESFEDLSTEGQQHNQSRKIHSHVRPETPLGLSQLQQMDKPVLSKYLAKASSIGAEHPLASIRHLVETTKAYAEGVQVVPLEHKASFAV